MSGEGDTRDVAAVAPGGDAIAQVHLAPREGKGSVLDVTVDTGAGAESLIVDANGAISGGGSPKTTSLVSALIDDLRAFAPVASSAVPIAISTGKNAAVRSGLTYTCGSTVGPNDTVRCGTTFFGETNICIIDNTSSPGAAWISFDGNTYGVPPYNASCWNRWFWGADVYVTNRSSSGVPLTVTH